MPENHDSESTLNFLATTADAPAASVAPGELPAGTAAGDYILGDVLGHGGTGTVYLATRPGDSRPSAVKVLRQELSADPTSVERFLREVQSVERIRHANIIDIRAVGRLADDRPFFAMEVLDGMNLRSFLAQHKTLSPLESLPIVEAVCGALSAAHAAGIVHRDVKPENVMMCRDGRIKLVDFGIAKLMAPDPSMPGLTTTGQFLGTPVAMAPEQIRCEAVDARTDIYGLGILVYNLLVGRPPFRGNWEVVVLLHLTTPAPKPSDDAPVNQAIDAAVLRCLEKEPAARFPSASAFLAAYTRAVLGEEAGPRSGQPGVGVLVRVIASAEADDDAIADASLALEDAGAALGAAGFRVVLETPRELLAVTVTGAAPADQRAALSKAGAEAQRLHDQLTGQLPPGIEVAVIVHCDDVELRDGDEIVGGPLLEIGEWAHAASGVALTPKARSVSG